MQIRTTDLNIAASSTKAKVRVRIHIASGERLGSSLWLKCENVVQLWLLTFFSGPMNAAHALAQAWTCACWRLRGLGIPLFPACRCHYLVDHILSLPNMYKQRHLSLNLHILCNGNGNAHRGKILLLRNLCQCLAKCSQQIGPGCDPYFFLHYVCFYFISWNVILSLLKPIIKN